MRIYTVIKPTRVESATKDGATAAILERRRVAMTWSNTANGAWATYGREIGPSYVIGINYEKRRHKKVEVRSRKSVEMVKVRQTHWIAHYYVFYEDFLKSAGIRVKQNSRNFVLERVKK